MEFQILTIDIITFTQSIYQLISTNFETLWSLNCHKLTQNNNVTTIYYNIHTFDKIFIGDIQLT